MKRNYLVLLSASLFLFLNACTTCYMSLESFKQQFEGIDSTKLKEVTVHGVMGEVYHYSANPITTIRCTDKDGDQEALLQNSPSVEIIFTYGENNKRTIFYFDSIFLRDSSVAGLQSRFVQSIGKPIPLSSIKKIKVQEGIKTFHYVNNN